MNQDMIQKIRRSVVKHEEYCNFPYVDPVGKVTIGIGYNLTDRGIDDTWINNQYQNDVRFFFARLSTFDWFKDLNTDRQVVLVDMCFMGWQRFLEFKNLIHALSVHDYKQASLEMLNSEWAQQVKSRAANLAQGMLTGEYNI